MLIRGGMRVEMAVCDLRAVPVLVGVLGSWVCVRIGMAVAADVETTETGETT